MYSAHHLLPGLLEEGCLGKCIDVLGSNNDGVDLLVYSACVVQKTENVIVQVVDKRRCFSLIQVCCND